MRITFFKLPRNHRFEYRPLYWDPEKEEREKREQRIKRELGITDENDGEQSYGASIKGQFKRRLTRARPDAVRQKRAANIRLVIILLFLAAGAYFLLLG